MVINEKADDLTREGSVTSCAGPDPAPDTTKTSVRSKYLERQQTLPKLKYSKLPIKQTTT